MMTISITRTRERYFRWLCDLIGSNGTAQVWRYRYSFLLLELFEQSFIDLIPNDINRAIDGKALRTRYQYEMKHLFPKEEFDFPCSVLEMMIALSERMAWILLNPIADCDELDTQSVFWKLINNLHLVPEKGKTDLIIDQLLNRRYSSNGDGGLFPLRNPREDQREVEIWYQMMAYISENY